MAIKKTPLVNEALEPLIVRMRGQRVMLDADLARLYGVTTKALNQAVKRNSDRFPLDFAFQVKAEEVGNLKSQFVISSSQSIVLKGKFGNRSQIVTGSQKHRDPRNMPWAFTEHGALMAANILRSDQAVQMSVFVIRAFVRMREQVAANTAIIKRLAEIDIDCKHSGRRVAWPHHQSSLCAAWSRAMTRTASRMCCTTAPHRM